MPDPFDPYHRWLGIPPEEQPPHYYRLLALKPFEADPNVIENAADQRMSHLRTFQTGKHSELSQKLLNAVAAAKLCLLHPDKKAAYDARLRKKQAAKKASNKTASKKTLPRAVPLAAAPKRPEPLVKLDEEAPSLAAARKRRTKVRPAVVAVVVGLLVLVGLIIWRVGSGQGSPEQAAVVGGQGPIEAPPKVDPPGPARAPVAESSAETEQDETAAATTAEEPVEEPAPQPEAVTEPEGEPEPQPEEPGKVDLPSAQPEEPKKLARPSVDVQRELLAQLEDIYDLKAAKTGADKIKLAEKVFNLGKQSKSNPSERFVLLRKAMELACEGVLRV